MTHSQTSKGSGPSQRIPVGELDKGDLIVSDYLVSEIEQRAKKNGEPFFSFTLSDATGSIHAIMWDGFEPLLDGAIRSDDFVSVEGSCTEYNGALQMTVRRIHQLPDAEVNASDYLPVSPLSREEMEKELDEWIGKVTQRDCRRILDRLFSHGRFRDLFCSAPAAVKLHQAYISGLLEHTLSVLRNAVALAKNYEPIDYDLLITAGILHDIGKIREYDWSRTIRYTDEGRLLGHISMGASMADAAMRELGRQEEGFSKHYQTQILHIILSHHGKLEFGSPTLPKTKEALVMHYADYTDAYLVGFNDAVKSAQERNEPWTGFNRMFQSFLYAGPGGGSGDEEARMDGGGAGGGNPDDA